MEVKNRFFQDIQISALVTQAPHFPHTNLVENHPSWGCNLCPRRSKRKEKPRTLRVWKVLNGCPNMSSEKQQHGQHPISRPGSDCVTGMLPWLRSFILSKWNGPMAVASFSYIFFQRLNEMPESKISCRSSCALSNVSEQSLENIETFSNQNDQSAKRRFWDIVADANCFTSLHQCIHNH